MNLNPKPLLLLCCAAMCLLMAGCGGGVDTAPGQPAHAGLPSWPPADGGAMKLSSDVLAVDGSQFASKSDTAFVQGTQLNLLGGGSLPWAIYNVQNVLAPDGLGQVSLTFTVSPATPGDGIQLFVGYSNYADGAWEWRQAGSSPFQFMPQSGMDYVSGGGSTSIAVALAGPGSSSVTKLTVSRPSVPELGPPVNLAAVPGVDQIELSWDPVAAATGYFVERATALDFNDVVRVNTEPVTEPVYTDTNGPTGRINYYRVVSESNGVESAPSDFIDVYWPKIDLTAPSDFVITGRASDRFTVSWGWGSEFISGFQMYVSLTPDFSLGLPDYTIPPFIRSKTLYDLQPNTVYYVRIAAYSGSFLGRMTDDIPASTRGVWTWNTPEELGDGVGPVAGISAGGNLSAAYLTAGEIRFATRNGSSWTSETAFNNTSGELSNDVDVAYSGSSYCIAAFRAQADDVVAAIGTPGNWTQTVVDGDGTTGIGHPVSGLNCRVAATSSEFGVVHYSVEEGGWQLVTRPVSGGNWTSNLLLPGASLGAGDIGANGSEFTSTFYEVATDELLFGSSEGGWTFQDISPGSLDETGRVSSLVSNGTNWLAAATCDSEDEHYLLIDSSSPWASESIGSYAAIGDTSLQLYMMDGQPLVLSLSSSSFEWFLSVMENGNWSNSEIEISGADLFIHAALAVHDSSLYFIYFDNSTQKVMCSPGSPPSG